MSSPLPKLLPLKVLTTSPAEHLFRRLALDEVLGREGLLSNTNVLDLLKGHTFDSALHCLPDIVNAPGLDRDARAKLANAFKTPLAYSPPMGDQTVVQMRVYFVSLKKLEEKSGNFQIKIAVDFFWKDPKVESLDGLTEEHLSSDACWIPKVNFPRSTHVLSETSGKVTALKKLLVCRWFYTISYQDKIWVTRFPFDSHNLIVKIVPDFESTNGFWHLDSTEENLVVLPQFEAPHLYKLTEKPKYNHLSTAYDVSGIESRGSDEVVVHINMSRKLDPLPILLVLAAVAMIVSFSFGLLKGLEEPEEAIEDFLGDLIVAVPAFLFFGAEVVSPDITLGLFVTLGPVALGEITVIGRYFIDGAVELDPVIYTWMGYTGFLLLVVLYQNLRPGYRYEDVEIPPITGSESFLGDEANKVVAKGLSV